MRLVTVSLAVAALAAPALSQAAPPPVAPSDRIVVAVVEEQSSRWQGNLIHTDSVLRIEERLLGDAPERITVTLPGGTIGEETHGTSLWLPLEMGERYLLFLDGAGRPIVGGAVPETPGIAEEVRAFLVGEERDLRALAEASAEGLRAAWEAYQIKNPAVPPIVVNPLPASSPFSPYDQQQMAYWNVYAPDLFRVAASPSANWSFGNGVSDIAGFPDDAKMKAEFGEPWRPDAYSQTSYRLRDGHIVEADIALNPAFEWTLDEDRATRPNGPQSFRRFILNGLGTAWGLRPSFSLNLIDRESVIGVAAQPFRLAILFADDTAAARGAFGGTAIRDGLISSYSLDPFPLSPFQVPVLVAPKTVRRGGRFQVVNPAKIENPGTEDLVDPEVEVYLVPQRFSMEGAIVVKRLRVQGTLPSGALRNFDVGRIKVPRTVPSGTYFLAFHLKAAGDEYPPNDFAWSDSAVTLTVKAR